MANANDLIVELENQIAGTNTVTTNNAVLLGSIAADVDDDGTGFVNDVHIGIADGTVFENDVHIGEGSIAADVDDGTGVENDVHIGIADVDDGTEFENDVHIGEVRQIPACWRRLSGMACHFRPCWFRHDICHDWMNGNCSNRDCLLAHGANDICTDWLVDQTCPKGFDCPFLHGVGDHPHYPPFFRVSLCQDIFKARGCRRRLCPFRHELTGFESRTLPEPNLE